MRSHNGSAGLSLLPNPRGGRGEENAERQGSGSREQVHAPPKMGASIMHGRLPACWLGPVTDVRWMRVVQEEEGRKESTFRGAGTTGAACMPNPTGVTLLMHGRLPGFRTRAVGAGGAWRRPEQVGQVQGGESSCMPSPGRVPRSRAWPHARSLGRPQARSALSLRGAVRRAEMRIASRFRIPSPSPLLHAAFLHQLGGGAYGLRQHGSTLLPMEHAWGACGRGGGCKGGARA